MFKTRVKRFFLLNDKSGPLLFLPAVILFCFACGLKFYNCYIASYFFVISVVLLGYKVIKESFFCVIKFKFSEKVLIAFSCVAALFLGDVIESFFLLFFFILGERLESVSKERSNKSISDISKFMSSKATLIVDNKIKVVDPLELKVGDRILVHPFERIPCDGVVIEGESEIDKSAVTGESEPNPVFVNEKVYSGSINRYGSLKIEVLKVASESSLARVFKLINENQKNKSSTERFILKFAKKYTIIVLFIALFLLFIPWVFSTFAFEICLKRALSFVVASCPCSIVVSVPLAFFNGMGILAKRGVLFKGSRYLESLSNTSIVFFDKTGTLTKNVMQMDRIYSFSSLSENEILELFSVVESYSKHPFALLLRNNEFSNKKNLCNVSEFPGLGIVADLNGKKIICGSAKLLFKNKIKLDESIIKLPVYLAIEDEIVGGISFKSEIHKNAKTTIKYLKKLGIKSTILSGDNEDKTKKVAEQCDIKDFYFSLLPEDKLKILDTFKQKNNRTAFVGDGINDAPSLAAADCGIALGHGSDLAVETADVVLKGNDILLIPWAISFARKVMKKVNCNIFFALTVKFFVLIFSFFSTVPLWLAVFADVGVTFLSVLNATTIRKNRLKF